jgi:hypothetical protein
VERQGRAQGLHGDAARLTRVAGWGDSVTAVLIAGEGLQGGETDGWELKSVERDEGKP